MRERQTWLVIWLMMPAACRDHPVAPVVVPDGPITLTVSLDPDTIRPGGASTLDVVATIPADQRLSRFQVDFTGLGLREAIDLPITGPGSHGYRFNIETQRVPIEGALRIVAIANVGAVSESSAVTLTIWDDGPPLLVLTVPAAVEPPDSLSYTYQASDFSELDSVFVRVQDGAGTLIDSVMIRRQAGFVFGRRAVWVAPGTRLGDSIVVQGVAYDLFRRTTTARHVVRFADMTPPALTVVVDTVPHPSLSCDCPGLVFVPGDTIRFRITATDHFTLGNIGYRWLQLTDSMVTARRADTLQSAIVVPPGTNIADARLAVWATDSSGNLTAQNVFIAVVDGIARPMQTLTLTGTTGLLQGGSGVLDTRRERYYFATAFENQVRAVGLAPLAQLSVATFGSTVLAVDLTPSGDSLVALLDPTQLVLWNIDAGPVATDTVTVDLATSGARELRVAANNHALVTGAYLVDVDLATGASRLRTFSTGSGLLRLAASLNRRYIMQWDDLHAAVYASDQDTLGPQLQLFPTPPPSMPLGNLGPYVHDDGSSLNRNRLYDDGLNVVRQVLPDPGQFPAAQALSPDGRWAYIGDWPGYWKVDVQSSAVVERVFLPRRAERLIPHPDGQRLIVLSGQWVGVVSLN